MADDKEQLVPMKNGVTLSWNKLSVYVEIKSESLWRPTIFKKKIINTVSGIIPAGNLVAVLGASGAGKSTLMTALASRHTSGVAVEGDIWVDGHPVEDFMKHSSGFMHQEDLFVETFTVAEHLMFMGHMKLGGHLKSSELRTRVAELISQLGLTDCMNTRIGCSQSGAAVLSGGEKKRLAFGTELLTDPAILFCDEPTSGLDSYFANRLVLKMKDMTMKNGKTVVCTIHQPSSELINLFHQIILVAEGRIVYSGSIGDALEFFKECGYECPSSYNPAEFLIKTVSPQLNLNIYKRVKYLSYEFSLTEQSAKVHYIPQESATIKSSILMGVLLGLCYHDSLGHTQPGVQSTQGAVFSLVAQTIFDSLYDNIPLFILQQHLFLREYRSGLYSPLVYYLSQLITTIPGNLLYPSAFAATFYWIAGLRDSLYSFFMSIFVMFTGGLTACALSLVISASMDDVNIALTLVVPINIMLQTTSGPFMGLSSMPAYLSWMKYVSAMMYTDEALTILQWDGVGKISCELDSDIPCLRNGNDVMKKYGFTTSHFWTDIYAMILLCVTFHICGVLIFLIKAHRRK